MQTDPPTLARPASRTIPYRWATAGQHAQAVLFVAQQLRDHFPTLSVSDFAQAYHAFQPDLWEDRNDLWLDYEDLVRLTQQLARSPLVRELVPPLYGADATYLAGVLHYYTRAATALLAELKADPQLPSQRFETLLQRLAVGNSVVERVRRETRSKAVAQDPQVAADYAV
ncbi:MAG TPA: hypothetical protein VF690_05785 [Hymenobacter sp.]|jgi:hypothetical protein